MNENDTQTANLPPLKVHSRRERESNKCKIRAATFSPSNQWHDKIQTHFSTHRTEQSTRNNPNLQTNKRNPFPCFSIDASKTPNPATPLTAATPPLVVVGSANADISVEIDQLPIEGETISAKSGQSLAGGKGANQAARGGKVSYPTYFVGQVGEDAHGKLIAEALERCGVRLDCLSAVSGAPTGHAVVMLQSDGQNSIIIVGGATIKCCSERISDEDLKLVNNAGIVLLQREIPESVNVQVAKFVDENVVGRSKCRCIPVILDAGGMDSPISQEGLNFVDILSPNETELGRLTGMPTETFEQISNAVVKCHKMGVKQVLVKLGDKGSALFVESKEPPKQPFIPAAKVLDTTGAGDTFTASFRGGSWMATAAASLCVQVKGAIPSMPERKSVLNLLQSL
ncbi:ribokinase [Pyrus ussuriensis x Pyrus communis]|uniref:Ribokinase n=1 Tax=Pyrus ussuriensis x Pyrus communis TaxID=2448454 RepID=A0A5N5GLR1_9ROSA|nr:ribokinase [Pyrus ussuriensis x Pyrus communis]